MHDPRPTDVVQDFDLNRRQSTVKFKGPRGGRQFLPLFVESQILEIGNIKSQEMIMLRAGKRLNRVVVLCYMLLETGSET